MRFRLLSLLVCGLLILSATMGHTAARTSSIPATSPTVVVANYFSIYNSTLQGTSVSQLAKVYTPNATLVVSTPAGKTNVFHQLSAIEGWYKAFAATHAGFSLKYVSERSPLPGMVVHYEIAVNAVGVVKGRCAHIFAVVNGMIVSDDFIVFAGS